MIDSHSHLHDSKFSPDRTEVLVRAKQAGVTTILALGDNLRASRDAIALAEECPLVLAAAGIHPSSAECWDGETAAELRHLLKHPRVAVLGEIGLDHYWRKDSAFLEKQRECFRDQLALAKELRFPVSIHTRESTRDVVDILSDGVFYRENPGVLHCFLGTAEEGRRALDLGFFIGVGGVATYPKANEVRAMLRDLGPERLMIETDAPYLAPQPWRGKRNEPAYLTAVVAILSEIFGISEARIIEITDRNATAFLARGLGAHG